MLKFHHYLRLTPLLLGAIAISAQGQQQPVFRAGANLVTVDVYPTKDGRIVEGLTAADFEVFEDGKPQKVDSFEFVRIEPTALEVTRRDPNTLREMYAQMADPHTRVFVMFLDYLHTSLTGSHSIRRPLLDMLSRVIGPSDLFGVMRPRMRPQDLAFGRGMIATEKYLTEQWDWGEKQNLPSGRTDQVEVDLNGCFHKRIPPPPEKPNPVDWIVDQGAVQRFLDEVLIERHREDLTLTALEQLVAHLTDKRDARTVVIAITDGWVLFQRDGRIERELPRDLRTRPGFGSPVTEPFSRARVGISGGTWTDCVARLSQLAQLDDVRRLRDLTTAANQANVSFYPVAASGLQVQDGRGAGENSIVNPRARPFETVMGRDLDRLSSRLDGLRTLAENTDGLPIVQTNDLAGGMQRIEDDVSAYYLLGYYSTNTKQDGKLRHLQVKLKPAGVNVRARRWYRALTDTSRPAAGTGRGLPPSGGADVDNALAKLGMLRGPAEAFLYGAASPKDVAVVVELGSGQLSSPSWTNGGTVNIELKSAGERVGTATGKIDPGARGVLLRVAAAGAGPWLALAHVTGAGASIDERIEIAAPAGALLGQPLAFRATPSPRAPLRPVAEFQFRRTERVHVEWPVLKALDQRTARLLDRRGQPLALPVTVTERQADGVSVVAVDFSLGALAEGDYVIELVAASGAETERKLIAIRILQ